MDGSLILFRAESLQAGLKRILQFLTRGKLAGALCSHLFHLLLFLFTETLAENRGCNNHCQDSDEKKTHRGSISQVKGGTNSDLDIRIWTMAAYPRYANSPFLKPKCSCFVLTSAVPRGDERPARPVYPRTIQ